MNGFVDETTIVVTSGNGGDGAVSFRREKYVPRGGPDGGDGGKGGDVVFQVQANLKTLSHLKLKRIFRAGNGGRGARQRMHGRDGHDVTIEVPPGTVLLDPDTGAPIADLSAEGQVFTCLRGGRGGKGNWHYATSINQAPRYAQKGVPGETRELRAELHLIADVGFVGLPNAGKSTLLSVLTNARPLIADYPFTTRTPMLGLLRLPQRDVVLADIPGIIEGASRGRGLGLKFLRHIERCAALLYLVDLAGRDCAGTVKVLEAELAAHAAPLAGRPRILVGTKNDLPGSEAGLAELRDAFPRERIVSVSCFSRQGLSGLTAAILDLVSARRETDAEAGRTPWTELEDAGDKSDDVVAGNDRSENVARSDRDENVARNDRDENVARNDRDEDVARSDRA